eukprot:TRINITY_DN185_c0_g1_i1.p1 TRINITY_DN185_c0_g1~~TRINITY_DN185_c0_g1_i1.p1  ORF type:complete len:198 (+),score=75.38 TRINITY_DN185_c0_g1_i1:70-663(+)
MSNHGPSYGLDADLAAKRAATYDDSLEKEIRAWVESVVGAIPGEFYDGLKSGIVLCNLANALKPGSTKPQKAAAPFVQMENINSYLNFCRSYGIATTDLFQTVDLYEKKNPNAVLQNLMVLKREAGKKGVSSGGASAARPGQVSLTGPTHASASSSAPAARSSPAPAPAAGGGAKFCANCGTKSSGGKFCGNCGNIL